MSLSKRFGSGLMAIVLDNPEDAIELIELSLKELTVEGRSLWTPHEIDGVIDNLLELWQILKREMN
jgi:hypothetical protein